MSLKQILFNVLEKTIGDYIVGFSADQLKLGLWSGKIRLQDLEVNTAAVQKLGLPIVVHGGRIKSLELSIPWNRLGSSPVKIIIDGVYVLLAFDKGPGSLAPDELTERLSTVLRAQLARADAAFAKQLETQSEATQSVTHDEQNAKRGIVARYAAKIVDNLEVSVRRVHARFEVEQSAVGVTLSAFEARAVNEKWEATFVERDKDRHGSDMLLRNVVELQGLALYWQLGVLMQRTDAGKDIAATAGGFRALADKLDSLIAPHSPVAAKTLATSYILQPLDASLRLTRNDKDQPGLPRYRLDFKTADIARLAVKSTVMRAATTLVKRIEILRRQHALAKRHPAFRLRTAARPVTRANAKAWWQYAAEIACPALGAARTNRSAIDPVTIRRLRSRARYVELYTASLTSTTAEHKLSAQEDAEMREIELAVPFAALNVWRQTVLLHRRDLAKKAAAKSQKKAGSTAVPEAEAKPGFWGRLTGRGTRRPEADAASGKDSKSDDATLEDLEAIARRVEEEEARAKPPEGFELIRAIVHTGCQISLGDGQNTLSEFGVKLWAFARHTADGQELDLVAGLGELYLRDATGLAARSGILDAHNRLICHGSPEGNPGASESEFETCLAAASNIVPELFKDDDANRAVDSGKAAIQLLLSRRPLDLGKMKSSRLNIITRARPVRIAYHAPVIARILDVFKPAPEDQRALKKGAVEARAAAETYARRAAANALEKLNNEVNEQLGTGQGDTNFVFSMFVDAKLGAPTVVLPRNWYQSEGAYIIDTGAIILNGGIDARDARRQRWSAKICEANVARLDVDMDLKSNIIAPFGVSVNVLLSGPQKRAPPIALDIEFSPLSLSLAPASVRELLELAALLSKGLQADEHAVNDQSDFLIDEREVRASVPSAVSDSAEHPLVATADTSMTIAAPIVSFTLIAQLPLVELRVSSISGLAYVAKISSLQIDLAIRGAAGLTLRSTLKSISLYDERARFSIVESFSAADAVEAARAAVNARSQLPQEDEALDSSYAADDDALLSFLMITELTQLPESQSTFSATRISLSFSTLRAKCGAATLLPLKPLVEELFTGLSAFSKSPPRSDEGKAQKETVAAAPGEPLTPSSSLNVVATIGEISAVLLNEAGELAVASASLYGVAALWSSRPELKSAAVRVAELRLDDARPSTENSRGVFTRVVVPKRAKASSDGMLALVDYSDTNNRKNIEVLIRPVSIYVLPGPLYLTLSAVGALVKSLGTVFSRDEEPDVPSENTLSSQTDPTPPPHEVTQLPSLLTVDVKLPEAEVVLVRDASRRDSEALILHLGAHTAFSSETFENDQGGELALNTSLENLSMMLAEDGLRENETPTLHLLDPVGANVNFERRMDNEGNPYHTMLSAELTEIAARVSYRDVLAIIAMVCALMPPDTSGKDQASPATSSPASQGSHVTQSVQPLTKATKVATIRASLVFSGARIFLVDDSQGTSVPLLNLVIGALDARIDGPTTALAGAASCTFAATSFNRDCLAYEPLVRKFAVKVEINIARDVTTASSSQDIAITTEEIVEIICSATFLTDLIHISSRLKNEASLAVRGSSHKLKATRDAPPLLVANETELVLRCRVSDSDGPWLDLNPGERVPVGARSVAGKSVDSGSFLHSPPAVDIASQPLHSATPSFLLTRLVSGAPHRSVRHGFSSAPSLVDGISWHVGFDDVTGRVLAEFRSRVSASNRTPIPLELASVDVRDTATGTVVEPRSTKPLPIGLAQRGVTFKLRRHDVDNRWKWSTRKSLTVWAKDSAEDSSRGEQPGLGESKKQVVAIPGNVVPTQYVIFGYQRVAPSSSTSSSRDEAKVVLAPPLVIQSKLPCGFVLTLANSVAETRIRVGPGENVGCCDLDVSTNGVWLACRIANFRGKCETKLTTKNAAKRAPPGAAMGSNSEFSVSTPGLFELILRRDGAHPQYAGHKKFESVNDALQLELYVEKKHRGLGLQLTLSCPLWIVDRTRLGLGFALAPPQVIEQLTTSIFGGDQTTKAKRNLPSHAESKRQTETRQRVSSSLLGDVIAIWVASQRPHSLARPALRGETVYAEGDQVPYVYHTALPQPLNTAYRLVTYDSERCGPSNQPAIFNKIAQQHQHRMRRVGLESEAAKARRALRYITLRNDDSQRVLDVYVAVDSRVERTPEWLLDGGAFARAGISNLQIRKKKGPLSFRQDEDVRPYTVWRAEVFPESSVDLGPNDDQAMYLVFLALRDQGAKCTEELDTTEPTAAAVLANDATSHNDAAAGDWLCAWPGAEWLGQVGATLLCSPDGGKFAINRHAKKSAWSSRLTVGATSFPVSMEDGDTGILELDVRCSPLRGAFSNFGTLVEVGPRYALWNIDPDFQLYVRQKGQAETDRLLLDPGREGAIPWHWPKGKLPREIEFGCGVDGKVAWSIGALSVESVGGYALLTTHNDITIRIEVALNNSITLPPYESVVIYISVEREETALCVARNNASNGLDALFTQGSRLLARVPAGQSRILGWANISGPRKLEVSLDGKNKTTVDVDAVRVETTLGSTTYTAAVHVEEGTRFIDIGEGKQLEDPDASRVGLAERSISLKLAGIGISVVAVDAEKVRREHVYARLNKADVLFRANGLTDEFQLNISEFQVDNHAPSALWPTFIAPSVHDSTENALVSLTAVRARHGDGATSLRYFAARVLPVDIHADFSSLNTLAAAITSIPLDVLNAEEALAQARPAEWARSICVRSNQSSSEDAINQCDNVTEARRQAHRPRGYVELLMLHPMEATISFEPTPAEEHEVGLSLLSYARTLATISNASIRLNSFIVSRTRTQFTIICLTPIHNIRLNE